MSFRLFADPDRLLTVNVDSANIFETANNGDFLIPEQPQKWIMAAVATAGTFSDRALLTLQSGQRLLLPRRFPVQIKATHPIWPDDYLIEFEALPLQRMTGIWTCQATARTVTIYARVIDL